MKGKIFSGLLFFTILLLSTAFADETTSSIDLVNTQNNALIQDIEVEMDETLDTTISLDEPLNSAAMEVTADSEESCMEKLKNKFPKAQASKIREACKLRFIEAKSNLRKRVTTTPSLTVEQKERLSTLIQSKSQIRKLTANRELITLPEPTLKKAAILSRGELKRLAGSDVTPARINARLAANEELQNRVKAVRMVPKDKVKRLNEQIKNRYENIKSEKVRYLKAQEKLENLKAKAMDCKDNPTPECNQFKDQVKTESHEYMLRHTEIIINKLQIIKDKLESSENIDNEELQEKLSLLEEQLSKTEELKATLEGFDESTTAEEYKQAASTLKDIWTKFKRAYYKNTLNLVHKKVGLIIVKSNQIEERLDKYLVMLEEKGMDTSGIEEKLETFSSQVTNARLSYDEGMKLFNSAQETNSPEIYKQANEKFKQAHEYLKEAHESFLEIKKILKENNIEYSEDEEMDLEEEEEIDDASQDDETKEDTDNNMDNENGLANDIDESQDMDDSEDQQDTQSNSDSAEDNNGDNQDDSAQNDEEDSGNAQDDQQSGNAGDDTGNQQN